jgi:2'-5' RNA ligase
MTGSGLRLFIALELPQEVVRHLTDITATLQDLRIPGVRWLNPEGIHLTLKFLGNTPVGQVSPITAAMRAAAEDVSPFTVNVHGFGAFPNMRNPRVVWTAIQGNLNPLAQLQHRLEEELESAGFAKDEGPFSPHLTIGRVRGRLARQDIERLARAAEDAQPLDPVPLLFQAISLMESKLIRSGAVYRRNSRVSLT